MLNTFAIFEGGGAKGLAHIGAFKAAEERGVAFAGVAGTSAGAIAAALIAAGWSADELYNLEKPIGQKGHFEKDFLDFFDRQVWAELVALQVDAEATFIGASPRAVWCRAPGFYRRHRRLLDTLATARGFFRTEEFTGWLEGLLRDKVSGNGPGGFVLFHDITMPLKIIATDLTDQRIQIFGNGDTETPNERVADAVAASICIPFFFIPHIFQKPDKAIELVDGGLLSNFPAWVFDEERLRCDPLTPTLGFTLVEKTSASAADTTTLIGFAARLLTTALAGDAILETRQVANLRTVPLRVRVSTFDFAMTPEVKDDLFRDGWSDASKFFQKYIGPRDPQEMSSELQLLHSHMQQAIGRGAIHLRINVAMPTGNDRLRLLYTHNMDNDADDRLEFSMNAGATGLCWQTHDFVVCNLVAAKTTYQTTYRMTKYQQALVRRGLKSLLSVPVFDYDRYSPHRAKIKNPLIGVLNIDSDLNLLAQFAKPSVQQAAVDCAKAVWQRLMKMK